MFLTHPPVYTVPMRKKLRKPMESYSIRIYKQIMRKQLLNNLSIIFALIFLSKLISAGETFQPTFLILSEEAKIVQESRLLESKGAYVRQRIPPSILIADLPQSLEPNSIKNLKTSFTNVIDIEFLKPWGLSAVAAGLQWNKTFLSMESTGMKGMSSSAVRALVAQKSIRHINNIQTIVDANYIRCQWEEIEGALYYQIQMSTDESFANPGTESFSHHKEVRLPRPNASQTTTLYIRIRPRDHAPGDHDFNEDLSGSWSTTQSIEIGPKTSAENLLPPQLTSPINDFETKGFTLPLEWTSTNEIHRIQISRDRSFRKILTDEVTDGKEFLCSSQILHTGDRLFWRVKSWGDRTSGWSEIREFKIGQPAIDFSY
jgi:hypothetical protein